MNCDDADYETRLIQTVLSASTESMALVEVEEGRILLFNDAVAQAVHREPQEVAGATPGELFPAELAVERLARVRQVAKTGKTIRVREERKDRLLEMSYVPVPDPHGKITRVAVHARDLTDWERVAQDLKESQARLQEVFDASRDMIYRSNLKTLAREYISPAAVSHTGFTPAEIMGMTAEEFVSRLHDEDRSTWLANVAALSQQVVEPPPPPLEYRWRCKDGRYRWFSDSHRQIIGDDGMPEVLVGTVRDITDQKEREKSLQEAESLLAQATEDERKRIALEMHDGLGQDLLAIHLSLASVLTDTPKGVIDSQSAETLSQISNKLRNAMTQVRTICQGLYPQSLERFGLCATLRELCSGLSASGAALTFRCISTCKDSTRFPRNIEISMFRIAQEAVSNAIRHGQAKTIAISLDYSADRLRMVLVDDGTGFPPEPKERVGMGLISMRERARTMGGRVDIVSKPGNTSVSVTVPLHGGGAT